MKKQLLLFVFTTVFMTGYVSAQQGSILLGGNVGISSSKSPESTGEDKTTAIAFNPMIGYQFDDRFTAGIVVSIQSQKETFDPTQSTDNIENKTTSFGGGPFIRYTEKLSETFSWYAQLEGIFGSQKNTFTDPPNQAVENKASFFSAAVFPAIFINLKNNFGLNFSFGGLGFSNFKPDGSEASSSFFFNFGQTANIGISKNFGGRVKK